MKRIIFCIALLFAVLMCRTPTEAQTYSLNDYMRDRGYLGSGNYNDPLYNLFQELGDISGTSATSDTGGTVYFVDNNAGDDDNDGKSWDSPFLLISTAMAASHADIALTNKGANRNRIYVKGDDFDEDWTKLARKTDIIGVGSDDGSKRPRILGEHVIEAAASGNYMGCRFINMYFQGDTGDTYVFDIPSGQNGIEFIGCRFNATAAGQAYGIRNTTAHDMKIIGCTFDRAAIGNEGFTTAAIGISTGSVYYLEIVGNLIDSGIGIVINSSTIPTGGQISNNTIFAATLTIDDNSDKFYIANNTLISDAAYGATAYDFDDTFAVNNKLTCSDSTYTIPADDSVTVMSTAAIEADSLDKLASAADGTSAVYPASVASHSILAYLMDNAADPATANYDNTKHSLKAIGADTDAMISSIAGLSTDAFRGTITTAGATTLVQSTGLAGFGDGFFVSDYVAVVTYTTDALAPLGQVRDISAYTSTGGIFTVTAFTVALGEGDKVAIARRETFAIDGVALLAAPATGSLANYIAGTGSIGTDLGTAKSLVDALGTDGVALADDAVAIAGLIGIPTDADNAVDSTNIAANADGSVYERLEDLLVDTTLILADTGTAGVALAAGSITSGVMATNSIGADEMGTDAIDSDVIATNAIGADELAANSITSSEVATSAVTEIASVIATNTTGGTTVWYCDSDATAGGDGTTWELAWDTMTEAIGALTDNDILYVRGTTAFAEAVTSPDGIDNIKIIGISGSKRTPQWASGATGTSALLIDGEKNWEIYNMRFQAYAASTVACLSVSDGRGLVVDNCYFHGGGNAHSAIRLSGSCPQSIIRNSFFHEFYTITHGNAGNNYEATIWGQNYTQSAVGVDLINNHFAGNLDDVKLQAHSCRIMGNTFTKTNPLQSTTTTLNLVCSGSSCGGNVVTGNTFGNLSAGLTNANGYYGSTTDVWAGNNTLDGVSSNNPGVVTDFLMTTASLRSCEKSDSVPGSTDDALFTVSGGPIKIHNIVGIVTTTLVATTDCSLEFDVTTPAATTALSTAVTITNDAAGTLYTFTDATPGILTPTTAGILQQPPLGTTGDWIVPIGSLVAKYTGTASSGNIKWYMTYYPLSPYSRVVAAP